jgi:hypothetical protein
MPDLDSHACSGAFIMRCRQTNQEIRGCFTNKAQNADNYRGELLGALGPLLLIKAAVESNRPLFSFSNAPPTVNLHCDNRGVILHGNDPNLSIKDGQVHADLVRLLKLKQYSHHSPLTINWIHIKGHSDDSIAFHLLSPLQQLNIRCDTLAKQCLRSAIKNNHFTSPILPDEDIGIAINNTKIRSAIKTDIYKSWG